MIVKTKEEILNHLHKSCEAFQFKDMNQFSAQEISTHLSISRNLASQYLNELTKENKLIKINSRPVCFLHKKAIEQSFETRLDKNIFLSTEELKKRLEEDQSMRKNFQKLIGYNQSISYCIEQCKAAVKYPPNGLPVLLTGPSGSGKSYLARLMYEYGVDQGLIEKDKNFVIMNCAEYANNPENMMEALFGTVQKNPDDSYTVNSGYLELSNGGVLLLDEVHNLNRQCQEKLFQFMDSGIFRRIGDNRRRLKASVKLVFATTRAPQEALQKTLLRRIPVTVDIPSLEERTLEEKEEMIFSFLKKEAQKIGCATSISNQAFRVLMDYQFSGNVGELKNCISTSCANAFLYKEKESEELNIYFYHLPEHIISSVNVDSSSNEEKFMMRSDEYKRDSSIDQIINFFNAVIHNFAEYKLGKKEFNSLLNEGFAQMRQYYDYLVFERKYANSKIQAIEKIINQIFEMVEDKYQIHLTKNCGMVLARCIYTQTLLESTLNKWEEEHLEELEGLLDILCSQMPKEADVTEMIVDMTEKSLDIKLNMANFIFLILNIHYYNKRIDTIPIMGIVISHGYSTASSIADAVNQLIGTRVFEAIDMPLDTQIYDVVNALQKYIQRNNLSKELILMVDMGSLEDIDEMLGSVTNLTIGIINNISTALAVDVGLKIKQSMDMETILKTASEACIFRYKIIRNVQKEKAIIFTSESGTNTADRMRDLFISSLPLAIPVNIISYDYFRLMKNGSQDEIFKKYEVLFVSGVFKLSIEKIPFISIEDIIAFKETGQINHIFSQYLNEQELETFNQNLLRNFSLQNVVQYLTILNADKVLEMVEQALAKLQESMGKRFHSKTVIGLYVHISCLIERLVTKSPIETHSNITDFIDQHPEFIDKAKSCFRDVTSHYNVELPDSEIAYIYDYIKNAGGSTEVEDF